MPESGSLPQTASRAIAKPQRPRHTEIKSTVRTATPLNQVRVQASQAPEACANNKATMARIVRLPAKVKQGLHIAPHRVPADDLMRDPPLFWFFLVVAQPCVTERDMGVTTRASEPRS